MSGTTPARNRISRTSTLALRLDGLVDLRNALRALDEGLPAEMRGTNKRVVDEIIVPRARAGAAAHRPAAGYNARTGRSPYHWSDVVNSIRGLASQTSASVAMGSTARTKGWMLGWEFGSMGNNTPPHSNKSQYPPVAGTGTGAGRFFFPAIRSSGPEIVDAYARAVDALVNRAVGTGG